MMEELNGFGEYNKKMKKEKLYLYVLKGNINFKNVLDNANIRTGKEWLYTVNRNSSKGKQIMKIIKDKEKGLKMNKIQEMMIVPIVKRIVINLANEFAECADYDDAVCILDQMIYENEM